MTKKSTVGIIVALLGLVFVTSCSPVSMIRNNVIMKPTKLSTFKTITVNVNSKIKKQNTEKLVSKLKRQIVYDLNEEKLFKVIENDGELKLDVTITKIRKVSGAARILLGVLAGRAKIYAKCVLTNTKTNKILRKFEVEGESSGGSIFAGTTNQAIKEISKSIVNYLRNNM